MDSNGTIAPEQLYWYVEPDCTGSAQAGRYAFEAVLPLSVDAIHVVFTEHKGQRVWIGVEPSTMEAISSAHPQWQTCIPSGLPSFLQHQGLDPDCCAQLNVLQGAWLPAPIRELERSFVSSVAAVLVALLLLWAIAVEWKQRPYRQEIAWYQQATRDLLQQHVPVTVETQGLPAAARLEISLRQMEQARSYQGFAAQNHAMPAALASLWALWPDQRIQLDAFIFDQDQCTLRGRAPDPAVVQLLVEAVADWSGLDGTWQQLPPSVTNGDGYAEFFIRFVPAEGEP